MKSAFTSAFILAVTYLYGQHSDLSERLDAYMRHMNEQGLSAAVVCVRDGKVLLDAGYGYSNQENKIVNSTQTVSTVGSITKQFTAAAILKLEELGKISTKNTLGELLKDVPQDKKSISVHQLLTMTSGFVEALGDDYEKLGRSAFLERAMHSELIFEPGTSFLYSNVSYSILGALIEIISGQDYEIFCRKHLWLPAGMKSTGYVQPDWKREMLATGYNKKGENSGTSLDKVWDSDGPYWNLKCNGGVLSTCEDMYSWYKALRGEDVLNNKQKMRMYTPYMAEGPGGQSHYGYGWSIVTTQRNTRLITHNGGNGIYFADYLNYEDENTFVYVSSNSSKRGMQDVAWELGRMILIPGYEPEIRTYDPIPVSLSDIAYPDYRATFNNLIGFFESQDKSGVKAFIELNLGPGLLEGMPMEQHVALFELLGKDLDGAVYSDLLRTDSEFYMHFKLPDGTIKTLLVELNDMGKIRGIGIRE